MMQAALTRALSKDTLSLCAELLCREMIFSEETRNERRWLVEVAIRLKFGGLWPTSIHTRETLFDTAQAVSREVTQR